MLAYVKREFALMENVDGCTQREHNEAYFKSAGHYPKGWDPVECPHEVQYLWRHWLSQNNRRGNNGFGPLPIPNSELEAWERRTGIHLDHVENIVIDAIEAMYFRCQPKPKAPK